MGRLDSGLAGALRFRLVPPTRSGGLGVPRRVPLWAGLLGRNGDIAQLGERGVRNAEAEGSSPSISTIMPL